MLCLATATHNFKRVKITHIYLIWDQTFANLKFEHISFPILILGVIWSDNETD